MVKGENIVNPETSAKYNQFSMSVHELAKTAMASLNTSEVANAAALDNGMINNFETLNAEDRATIDKILSLSPCGQNISVADYESCINQRENAIKSLKTTRTTADFIVGKK